MKFVLLSFLLFFWGSSSYSQEHISYGVKAGINFANAIGDASSSSSQLGYNEGRTGFHIGFVSELNFSKKISFQSELLYSQYGASYFYDNRSFDGNEKQSDLKLDYINLPILAKYYVYKDFSLQLGPQFGYILNSEINNQIETSGFLAPQRSITENIDIEDDIHKFDVGMAIGGSYDLKFGLFVQARYVFGLTEVPKNENYTTSTNLRNAAFQLSLGYQF